MLFAVGADVDVDEIGRATEGDLAQCEEIAATKEVAEGGCRAGLEATQPDGAGPAHTFCGCHALGGVVQGVFGLVGPVRDQ